MHSLERTVATFAAVVLLAGCASTTTPAPESEGVEPALSLTSVDFADGGELPGSAAASAYAGQCDGPNTSPALAWEHTPDDAVSLALEITDTDAGGFVHAFIADIPVETTGVNAGALDAIGVLGSNDAGDVGYFGPCPPSGTHHYVFTLYALDTDLTLDEGFDATTASKAMLGHVLTTATLTGTFTAES